MKLRAGQIYGICESLMDLMEKELPAKSALNVALVFQTLNDKYRAIAQVVNAQPKDENGNPQKGPFEDVMKQVIEVDIDPLDPSIFNQIKEIKPKTIYLLKPIIKKEE